MWLTISQECNEKLFAVHKPSIPIGELVYCGVYSVSTLHTSPHFEDLPSL